MSILILKAKVNLSSEEQMEVEGAYDFGEINHEPNWVWRRIAVPVEEVYKVISYEKDKSIVQMYDGESFLVKEPFKDLSDRWNAMRNQTEAPETKGQEVENESE